MQHLNGTHLYFKNSSESSKNIPQIADLFPSFLQSVNIEYLYIYKALFQTRKVHFICTRVHRDGSVKDSSLQYNKII